MIILNSIFKKFPKAVIRVKENEPEFIELEIPETQSKFWQGTLEELDKAVMEEMLRVYLKVHEK